MGNKIVDGSGNVFVPYRVEIPGLWVAHWQNDPGMTYNANMLQNSALYIDAKYFWPANTLDIKVASADLFDKSPYDSK